MISAPQLGVRIVTDADWDYLVVMRWFAYATHAGMTSFAEKQVSGQGYETYSPRIREDGEHLFPNYGLVRCGDHAVNYGRLNSTKGVKRLLPQHCENPIPLRDGMVESLREHVGVLGSLAAAEGVMREFVEGEEVRVDSGPYCGLVGTFQKRRRGCLQLLMIAFGAPRVVQVPLQNIAQGRHELARTSVR